MRRSRSSFGYRAFFLMFLVGASFLLASFLWNKFGGNRTVVVHSVLWPVSQREATKTELPGFSKNLEQVVVRELDGSKGIYGIVVLNLKTGERYELNADRVFTSASLYKLWVMGTVYDKVNKGEMKLDDQITEDVEGLNRYFGIASESAELTTGAVNLTLESTINQMISISHNYAALSLVKKMGLTSIREFIKRQGLFKTTVGDGPETTPLDVSSFLERTYKGEVVNPSYSTAMINMLLKQEKDEVIPAKLPSGVKVAHKTGELDGFKHDAGIVYGQNGNDYVIVLMSESDNPYGAIDRMANISLAVYNYFIR